MRTIMTIFFVLLLCVAALLTLVIHATVADFHKSDAAGQGMAAAFAFFEALALAAAMAIMLLLCAANGGLRGTAAWLSPLSYAGTVSALFVALNILQKLQHGNRFETLLRIVVFACPALLILLSALNFFPDLRSRIPPGTANLALGIPIILLSAITLMLKGPIQAATDAHTQARIHAYQEAARQASARLAEINALPANSPLAAFLPYTEQEGTVQTQVDLRGAAVQRMCKLPNRQQEAETLLNQQDTRVLCILSDLDLQMTPALCAGARKSLRAAAEKLKPATPATSFDSIEPGLGVYTTNIRWLFENHCDCNAEVDALANTLRLYPDSFSRKQTLDWLDYLQGKPNPYGKK